MEKTKEEIKEEIEKEIKDSVDDFIGTIKKEPCCEYFSDKTEADWECEKVYKDALYQGYLDACRTIHWSTKAREDGDELLKRKNTQKIFDKLSNITVLFFKIKTYNIKTSDELRIKMQ